MSTPAADLSAHVVSALRGVRWYLRAVSGETKWDDYLGRCAAEGTPPMSRRAFERHRADHREADPRSRCC